MSRNESMLDRVRGMSEEFGLRVDTGNPGLVSLTLELDGSWQSLRVLEVLCRVWRAAEYSLHRVDMVAEAGMYVYWFNARNGGTEPNYLLRVITARAEILGSDPNGYRMWPADFAVGCRLWNNGPDWRFTTTELAGAGEIRVYPSVDVARKALEGLLKMHSHPFGRETIIVPYPHQVFGLASDESG